MTPIFAYILKKKNIFIAALCWTMLAIAFAGITRGRLESSIHATGETDVKDTDYHHNVSSVMTGIGAILLLTFLSLRSLRHAEREKLGRLLRNLAAYSLFALLIGGAIAFCIGWLKEVTDAMQKRAIDVNDLYADYRGIAAIVVYGGVLTTPVHLVASLLLPPARNALISMLCPKRFREDMLKARDVEHTIHDNQQNLQDTQDKFENLDREVRKLEKILASTPADLLTPARKQAIRNNIDEKRVYMEKLAGRIAELETENSHLHHQLEILLAKLKSEKSSALATDELGDIIISSRHAAREIAAAKTLTAESLKHAEVIIARHLTETKASPNAPTTTFTEKDIPKPITQPDKIGADQSPEHLQAQEATNNNIDKLLDDRKREIEELRKEMSTRNRQINEMEQESGNLRAKVEMLRASLDSGNGSIEIKKLQEQIRKLKRRILVVDDERSIREVVKVVLEDTGLCTVETAGDVFSALEILKTCDTLPDLIVLDIKMPKFSGTEFNEALQKSKRLSIIPIIFCSGLAQESVTNLNKMKYVDYIRKPFRNEEIRNAVCRALGIKVE